MLTWLQRLRATFAVDLRALALLRLLLGGMILVDTAIRAVSLKAHYTDFGIVPADYAQRSYSVPYPGRFSFHLWSGEPGLQIALMVLACVSAVALALGYRTKLALLLCFLLQVSIQNRNFEVETGGDYVLRMVLFWCLFLPLGARFSLDRRAGRVCSKDGALSNQHFSVASAALIVQVIIIYFFSAIHKSHPIWRTEFTAIHYALHIDAYDTAFGAWLRQYPSVTALLTRVTLWFEFASPWFLIGPGLLSLLPPFRTYFGLQGPLRMLAVFLYIGFHVGLGVSLSLGTFAWFAALIWLGMLPPWAFDKALVWSAAGANEGARAIKGLVSIASQRLRSTEAPLRKPSKNEQRLLQISAWFSDAICAVSLALVVLWNATTVDRGYNRYINGQASTFLPDMRPLVNVLRLDQHWGLFAPYPRTIDGYYVVPATRKDGKIIDLLSPDFQLTWRKPDDVSGSYETFRWRKYYRTVRSSSQRRLLRLYADYLCRNHNYSYREEESVENLEIYFMARRTLREGGHAPTEKKRLWSQRCP